MPRTVAVFGSSAAAPEGELAQRAQALGRALARAGFRVMTGGYAGDNALRRFLETGKFWVDVSEPGALLTPADWDWLFAETSKRQLREGTVDR